jgi:putative FmdB family regulatory protein
MPIYEYYCQDCNTKFELIRDIAKVNDPAKCQKCGSNNTKRLISKFYSQGSSENSSRQVVHPAPAEIVHPVVINWILWQNHFSQNWS